MTAETTTTRPAPARGRPPQATVLDLTSGYWKTQVTYVITVLGVPDVLGDTTAGVAELAVRVSAPADPLRRLLRAGAGLGLLRTDDAGRYALTETGQCLRTGVPQSVHHLVLLAGAEHYRTWGRLHDAIRTGEPQLAAELGRSDWWSYLGAEPAAGRVFDAAMAELSRNSHVPALIGYDFSGVQRIVDVGGGTGTVLATLLRANPHLTGVLFDLPAVVDDVDSVRTTADVQERCERVAGDVFAGVPGGADCYLLCSVLHDHPDDSAAQILAAVRAVIPPDGTLLVVEPVIPADDSPHFAKLNDLNMLVMIDGRERTEDEFRALLGGAGFHLEGIAPSSTPAKVLVARPNR
jgi:SAM-dependent methyltransferase